MCSTNLEIKGIPRRKPRFFSRPVLILFHIVGQDKDDVGPSWLGGLGRRSEQPEEAEREQDSAWRSQVAAIMVHPAGAFGHDANSLFAAAVLQHRFAIAGGIKRYGGNF